MILVKIVIILINLEDTGLGGKGGKGGAMRGAKNNFGATPYFLVITDDLEG